MDYRLSRKIMWIGIDAGLVLLAASMCFKNEKIQVGLMIAAVALYVIDIIIRKLKWSDIKSLFKKSKAGGKA